MGGGAGEISLVGGGALSATWPAIIADVLDAEISIPADPVAATSRGAFRISAHALGLGDAKSQAGRRVPSRADRRARIERLGRRFAAATEFLRTLA
jgi:xylulokinase